MRILLLEDDKMIAEALSDMLHVAGFAVDCVTDGLAAESALQPDIYDIALLDIGVPKQDGLSVLRHLRAKNSDLPVILITARDTVEERINGLDSGADDYVIKPFAPSELLARIRALLRRRGGHACPVLSNGVITLNPATREVSANGLVTRLSAREYALLYSLLLQPGTILSRQELEEKIYGWNEEVESNAVEVVIHGIRKKLGSNVIKNVRGLGWLVDRRG
ncbi:DNA-binding response regulator [Snodgrassella communis]|jgi:two-component system, OmpR family, response regulator|uniref:DNA-binding response regulator n=2 Tax=Snodgrassella TaxID=1193515 RepID=A0A2N9XLW1_9NEIS|nr:MULTISPECIES: response regulator transcription factor [Snodgrassella]KDN11851.1 Two-component system response regulator QseB [Snodgrassella communis]KDN14716.1 Two-component system response regulator QseB [Snodgrassella communis]PIT07567.1 DNA-binding response regulator [Snodgrassella communis]PIT08346.1 DNA-binding response regulator [Snodgrassella communis]PIT20182.1 DNA-binding response regulator [Snodgrassella communis]